MRSRMATSPSRKPGTFRRGPAWQRITIQSGHSIATSTRHEASQLWVLVSPAWGAPRGDSTEPMLQCARLRLLLAWTGSLRLRARAALPRVALRHWLPLRLPMSCSLQPYSLPHPRPLRVHSTGLHHNPCKTQANVDSSPKAQAHCSDTATPDALLRWATSRGAMGASASTTSCSRAARLVTAQLASSAAARASSPLCLTAMQYG